MYIYIKIQLIYIKLKQKLKQNVSLKYIFKYIFYKDPLLLINL